MGPPARLTSRAKRQSKKEPAKEAKARRNEELAQLELAAFGDTTTNTTVAQLTEPERWWSKHYNWLKDNGYILRPRYAPDWSPSWQGTKKSWLKCEDSFAAMYPARLLDGTRASDGAFVTFKLINRKVHPHEIEIGLYFSSQQAAPSANHCVPVFDVLPVPNEEVTIIVMPLLQVYTHPPFGTFGEVLECITQLFEGLNFMHKHRVAHRDCSSNNIMMDPSRLYIDAFHPASLLMKRDVSGYARYKTRTEQPPRYFLIDFGLSRRYDDSVVRPMEVPIWGADKEVPEFQNSNAPCDPFATDVFYIGNAIRKDFVEPKLGFDFMRPLIFDMIQKDPSKRPTMDEVIERFGTIKARLSGWKLRSRVVDKGERTYHPAIFHWMRQIGFLVRGIPALPRSS